MKYTKVAEDAFKKLQLNAGILLDEFTPASGEIGTILGATSGGVKFAATPTFTDFGEDVDNCPNNMMEFKQLKMWEVKMSGTFIATDTAIIKTLCGAADIDGSDSTLVKPRNTLSAADFSDIWWVGDISDDNDGFIAIHMLNTLSTGGFQLQSSKDAKGQFAFEFTGHYSLANQDQVPFEVYYVTK